MFVVVSEIKKMKWRELTFAATGFIKPFYPWRFCSADFATGLHFQNANGSCESNGSLLLWG